MQHSDQDLSFPPAMRGEQVDGDPMEIAVMQSVRGVDAGLIPWRVTADRVAAAIIFAPEVPLADAVAMLPLCGVGLQNALGALAPPEVAVHLGWDGDIRVNGASCGAFQFLADTTDPEAIPDWMVIGFSLRLLPIDEDTGHDPDRTALFVEGCADLDPYLLIEAWARHTLNWLARWESEGIKPLHAEWRGLAHGVGEETTINGQSGTFLGVDERFGMLLRDADTTHLIPLTTRLENAP